jgi:hypothetical protein
MMRVSGKDFAFVIILPPLIFGWNKIMMARAKVAILPP